MLVWAPSFYNFDIPGFSDFQFLVLVSVFSIITLNIALVPDFPSFDIPV